MSRRPTLSIAVCALAALGACATPRSDTSAAAVRREAAVASLTERAVETAVSMIGVPYRYAGSSPRGFDCSGLVVYSYAKAGVAGLPHSSAALERKARPVAVEELEPGDLLFFDLEGKKSSHVGIYVGDRAFVHAPSAGKRVERIRFDHVYWGPRIERAGRIAY